MHWERLITKLILYGVILLALAAWGWYVKRSAARRIKKTLDASFQPDHVFRRANPSDYPWLTAAWYDGVRTEAEAAGFAAIADIEDETLSEAHPDKRTFVRLMASPDGETRLACYEIAVGGPQGAVKQHLQTCELISELSDGTSHTSTTTPAQRLMNPPPGVYREHVSPAAPLAQRLTDHQARLRLYLQSHPGVQAVPVRTYDEAIAAWQAGIDRQRKRLEGGLTREEMVRFAPPDRKQLAADVHDHLKKLE